MSTKGTLYLSEDSSVHAYHDVLDDQIHVESRSSPAVASHVVLTWAQWREMLSALDEGRIGRLRESIEENVGVINEQNLRILAKLRGAT